MNSQQIYETSHMISNENLDVRTITMGISLLDCIDSDSTVACQKIYDKITTKAKNLVKVGQQIEAEYGIPIANKRVTVTPISLIAAASQDHDYVKYAKTLDKAAKTLGIDFIGGYSALVQKGYQTGDRTLIASLPEALAETDFVCASVNVGSTRSGINMDAVAQMGEVVVAGSKLDMMTNAKLVIFCNAVEDNPFMAGGFHGVGEPDVVINVGVSGQFKQLDPVPLRGEDQLVLLSVESHFEGDLVKDQVQSIFHLGHNLRATGVILVLVHHLAQCPFHFGKGFPPVLCPLPESAILRP